MIYEKTVLKCAACGNAHEYRRILDKLSYFKENLFIIDNNHTLMKCPYCGYTAYDIESETKCSRNWETVRKELHLNTKRETEAQKYYNQYKIELYNGNITLAFINIYYASTYNFLLYSRKVLSLIKAVKEENKDFTEELELLEIDYLRRGLNFHKAYKMLINRNGNNFNDYFDFEKYLINRFDFRRKKEYHFNKFIYGERKVKPEINSFKKYVCLKLLNLYEIYELEDVRAKEEALKGIFDNVIVLFFFYISLKIGFSRISSYLSASNLVDNLLVRNFKFKDTKANIILNASDINLIKNSLKTEIPYAEIKDFYPDTGNITDSQDYYSDTLSVINNKDIIRLWFCPDVTGICFLYLICYLYKDKRLFIPQFENYKKECYGDISKVFDNPYCYTTDVGFRELSIEEKKNYKNRWIQLSESDDDFRGMVNGEIVSYSYETLVKKSKPLYYESPSDYIHLYYDTKIETEFGISRQATKMLIDRMLVDRYIEKPIYEKHQSLTEKLKEYLNKEI